MNRLLYLGCSPGEDIRLLQNDLNAVTALPSQKSGLAPLVAEWLAERARFIGSLIGLTDAQFNSETAPGQWTYRVIAKHVLTLEQDSLKTLAEDQAARAASR